VLVVAGPGQWSSQRRGRCKLVTFAIAALLLISSLLFCFPVYLKEVVAPVTGMIAALYYTM